jgi:anti-anti-sigma regulatory factor
VRLRKLSVRQRSVLQLGGDITVTDATELRRFLADLLVSDTGDMVICDLSRIRSADPQALTVLATPHGQEGAPGPSVCLAGARGEVAATMDRLGLAHLVTTVASVSDALGLGRSPSLRLCEVRLLPRGASAPRLARRFVVEVCGRWGLGPVTEDVEQVTTELVTNAVVHARTELVLRLERSTDRVVVAVHDEAGDMFPSWWRGEALGDGDDQPVWGNGLTIVRALAETAGVSTDPAGGKVVWAALRATPAFDAAGAARPHRWRLTVNSGRRPGQESRWVVRLELVTVPDRPELVSVSLTSQPRHPSLPRGKWRVARSALHDGLEGPVRHGDVRLRPGNAGRELVLELPGNPTHIVRVSAGRVRQFLMATAPPGGRAAYPGRTGRTATTAATGSGP